ncbi:MAG TPA: DUF2059 domain-containing protein [Lysobacter sp.]|nr:DUF2059 domain-containing protein [Lysobacter sp.]
MKQWAWGMAMVAALTVVPARAATNADYEAALDRYYELTVGRELGTLNLDEVVESFRKGVLDKPEAKSCPALGKVLNDFADNEFRTAAKAYFDSPALREEIEGALRKHLTLEDLRAFIAFAQTPAGAKYLENSSRADAAAKKAIEASAEKLYERPEFQTMMSQMVVKLMPAMMECKK